MVPNGSPYARDKNDLRLSIAVARVTESGLPLVYLNQIGGQDELVFDGASFALNADLSVAAQLPAFEESITTLRWTKGADGWRCSGPVAPLVEGDKGDYAACVLGLRDYVRKNGFPGVLLGVSGGIDSALCAAIAVDALGADRVRGVMLPFRFTAQVSLDDAAKLAKALGFRYEVLPIADAVNGFEKILSEPFAGLPRDITEENLQARTRGTLLMAISNKTGAMVVTTGNKSEMSVGYATLYGDMNGGFNPIKDIYKTEVFRLSSLRNEWKPDGALGPSGEVIPVNIITRPPTAELRENQTDQDSLPPYEMLDAHPGTAGRARGAAGHDHRGRFPGRRGDADRPAAQHRRIQAAAGGARRQGDGKEFRPRPPLSHHQPFPRRRQGVARARREAGRARRPRRRRKRSRDRAFRASGYCFARDKGRAHRCGSAMFVRRADRSCGRSRRPAAVRVAARLALRRCRRALRPSWRSAWRAPSAARAAASSSRSLR